MPCHKSQRSRQLTLPDSAHRLRHAKPFAQRSLHQPRAQHQVQPTERRTHHVVGAHHLWATVRPKLAHNPVLRAVGQAVKQQVNTQQQHAPRCLPAHHGTTTTTVRLLLARVQREDTHAHSHGGYHEVLVQRVLFAEERNVEEHDGQQLAALGERVGDVVDVRERRIADGRGEGLADSDEDEGQDDALVWDDGRDGRACGRRVPEVAEAGDGREERLDDLKEDRKLPLLRGVCSRIGIRGGKDLFLEEAPGQAVTGRGSQLQWTEPI